jgi:hypothetical protein
MTTTTTVGPSKVLLTYNSVFVKSLPTWFSHLLPPLPPGDRQPPPRNELVVPPVSGLMFFVLCPACIFPLLPLDPFQYTAQQYSWSTPRPRHNIPSAQLHEEYLIHQIVFPAASPPSLQ